MTPNPPALVVRAVRSAADLEALRNLFTEYAQSLNFSLCFQGFDEELATLPGKYAPPAGNAWLAEVDGRLAGCVAVRPLERDICEMKRLFIRGGYRGLKLGRALAETTLEFARRAGYRAMRLDTVETMLAAMSVYRTLGFVEIPAYYDNPLPGVHYFEKRWES
ncbi:MAG: GNAT family N-acetyltransferase [Alphaproteobacteria bacterium]